VHTAPDDGLPERHPLSSASDDESSSDGSGPTDQLAPPGGERFERFESFYEAKVARLVAYLIACGARPAEAADCAQETMVRAYQSWPELREPYAWCRQVSRRLYLRRARGLERPFYELEAVGEPLLQEDHRLDEVVVRHRVAVVLRSLPFKQRQVMVLTMDGLTPSEIALDPSAYQLIRCGRIFGWPGGRCVPS
jgi:DNA-directed RNA polymerase specialized sigma24 family protein